MERRESPRILIMGAGAIGGTVAACLDEVGADVTAVTTNRAIHDAVRDKGFRTTGESGERAVPGRIELGTEALASEAFDGSPRARASLVCLATGRAGVAVAEGGELSELKPTSLQCAVSAAQDGRGRGNE